MVVLLASAVCPLVGEAIYVACASFLMGGTGGGFSWLLLWWAELSQYFRFCGPYLIVPL